MRSLVIVAMACLSVSGLGCALGLLGVTGGIAADKGPYVPGEIAEKLGPNAVRTLGCLDVGFAVSPRGEGDLLDFHVGNRCKTPHELDLQKLAVHAPLPDGRRIPVTLVDPRNEIEAVHVGGAERGHERIQLQYAELTDAKRICFDASGIAVDAPETRPEPVCLERALVAKDAGGEST